MENVFQSADVRFFRLGDRLQLGDEEIDVDTDSDRVRGRIGGVVVLREHSVRIRDRFEQRSRSMSGFHDGFIRGTLRTRGWVRRFATFRRAAKGGALSVCLCLRENGRSKVLFHVHGIEFGQMVQIEGVQRSRSIFESAL
jgi:hypothetical protein